jgi:hypothetical protein
MVLALVLETRQGFFKIINGELVIAQVLIISITAHANLALR